ncbi:MAG: hypothetical protein ABW185_06460 [Sedimenticola sp.]
MNKLEDSLMVKLRESVVEEIKQVRDSFNHQIKELTSRIQAIEDRPNHTEGTSVSGSDRTDSTESCTIVIRNLVSHPIKNVTIKVKSMIRDGLGITDINVVSAERKLSKTDTPGVVIAKCETSGQVTTILENKQKLRPTERYRNVYISRDVPRSQRIMNANMRTLIDVIGRDKLDMRGPFITRKNRSDSAGTTHRSVSNPRHTSGRADEPNNNVNRGGNNYISGNNGRTSRGGRGGRGSRGRR